MSEIVTLDLNDATGDPDQFFNDEIKLHTESIGNGFLKSDFRQHAQGTFLSEKIGDPGALPKSHWLLGTVYGRDVLKAYLAKMHPDIQISNWRAQPELDVWLERVIDKLELRDLIEPVTMSERVKYLRQMSVLLLNLDAVSEDFHKNAFVANSSLA